LVRQLDVVRLLLAGAVRPFEKSRDRNDAAAVLDSVAESRFLSDGLGAGVDQMAAEAQIFGPAGHETPPQQIKAVVIAVIADYGDLLSRGNIEARLKLRSLDQCKYFFEFICWYVVYESSAHI